MIRQALAALLILAAGTVVSSSFPRYRLTGRQREDHLHTCPVCSFADIDPEAINRPAILCRELEALNGQIMATTPEGKRR